MGDKQQIKRASITFLVTIIFFIVANGIFATVLKIIIKENPNLLLFITGNHLMIFQILLSFIASIPVLAVIFKNKLDFKEFLRFKRFSLVDLSLAILGTILMFPLISAINMITISFTKMDSVGDFFLHMASTNPILMLIGVALMPAIFEELQFRAFHYNSFKSAGYFIGGLTSAILFSMLHMNINQFGYAFVLGMLFSYLVEATGSVYITIIIHFLFNAVAVIQSQTGILKGTESAFNEGAVGSVDIKFMVILFIVGLIFALIGILVLKYIAKRNNRMDLIENYFKINCEKAKEIINIPLILGIIIALLISVSSALIG